MGGRCTRPCERAERGLRHAAAQKGRETVGAGQKGVTFAGPGQGAAAEMPSAGRGQGGQRNKPFRFRCFRSETPVGIPAGPWVGGCLQSRVLSSSGSE